MGPKPITRQILAERVNNVIVKQIAEHALSELQCDYSRVDWAATVEKAIAGKPPFNVGTDKGFKDAVILESLYQLAESLPASARVLLLSTDGKLSEAATERLKGRANSKVINEIGELKTLINALASHMDQSAIDKILIEASDLFFEVEKETTLYYKFRILEVIKKDPELFNPLEPGYSRAIRKIGVRNTTFSSKNHQQVFFNTNINLTVDARKPSPHRFYGTNDVAPLMPEFGSLVGANTFPTIAGIGGTSNNVSSIEKSNAGLLYPSAFSASRVSLLGSLTSDSTSLERQPPDVVVSGRQVFSVKWKATLGATGRISKPKLLEVKASPTEWVLP